MPEKGIFGKQNLVARTVITQGAVLTQHRLERGVFTSTEDIEAAIYDYIAETNAYPAVRLDQVR